MDLVSAKSKIKRNIYAPLSAKYHAYKKRKEFLRHVRKTDVFLVGHPKSGNTWLSRMIASLLESRFDYDVNLSNIKKIIPILHYNDHEIKAYCEFPNPRVFRNEGPIYADHYPKTIYILRDPRSVYVSYYHHCVHDTQRDDWQVEEFIDEMLQHGCIKTLEPDLVRWDKHVEEWVNRSKKQPVLFVRYEDIHKDKVKVLKENAEFIAVEYNQASIEAALEKSTFKNMRKEEVTFGAEPYSGDKGEKGFYVRKGKIDGWKEELPASCVKKIESEFSSMMKKFGYL